MAITPTFRKTLVCLGDSITAKEKDPSGVLKLVPRLQKNLSSWKIINSGIPGENTRGALARLSTDVIDYDPDLVTVLLGTADASENKGISIREYEQNLISIVEQISPLKTLLITSPPIDRVRLTARKQAFPQSNFVTLETLKQYVMVATKVARKTKCHFLDLWSIMRSQADYSQFLQLKDGVHFNQQGYEFLASVLTNKLQSIKVEKI